MALGKDESMAGKRTSGGSSFDWHPATYEQAKNNVEMAREQRGEIGRSLAQIMPQVLRQHAHMTGGQGLTCPSPVSDPTGKYQVRLGADGRPEIQRLDIASNTWGPVPATLDNPLAEVLDLLGEALMATDVDDIRALVQQAYDRLGPIANAKG